MLTALCIALAATFFYFGFVRPADPGTALRLKGGFAIMLALAAFSAWFQIREARTVQDLRELIPPVPRITEVTYVPTPGEIQAVADMVAASPVDGRLKASTQAMRRRFAGSVEDLPGIHWVLRSALPAGEVLEFYRDPSHQRDWSLRSDAPPSLILIRGRERMAIFVLANPEGSEVLYTYNPAREIR